MPKKFPNIWATLMRKFAAKKFRKSHNLVTLVGCFISQVVLQAGTIFAVSDKIFASTILKKRFQLQGKYYVLEKLLMNVRQRRREKNGFIKNTFKRRRRPFSLKLSK